MNAGSHAYSGVFLAPTCLVGGGEVSGPFRTFANYNLSVAEMQRDTERQAEGERHGETEKQPYRRERKPETT